MTVSMESSTDRLSGSDNGRDIDTDVNSASADNFMLDPLEIQRANQPEARQTMAEKQGAASEELIIDARDLHTYYGDSHILKGISLSIRRGETISLMGRNGMGKTTTLRSLLGLTPPRSGSVSIFSQQARGWPTHRIIQQGIAVGLGLIIGTLNVFFRDIGQSMQIILRFWFWLTPIIYPITILPDFIKDLVLNLNPMTLFIMSYQKIMLYNEFPALTDFKLHTLLMLLLLLIGSFFFVRLSPEMVDEL